MNNRIKKELMLLQAFYAKVTYNNNGQWVLIEDYPIPPELPWNRQKTNVCFQIPIVYPGTPPYGFYVPSGILCDNKSPNNYQDPANNKPPFPGEWGFFSWTQESGWHATDDPHSGSNLLSFVRTLRDRFIEGG